MVSRRGDDTSIKRRAATRSPKRRILIVCEGQETERRYLESLRNDVRNSRVHVEVAKPTGVPLTVVQAAIDLRATAEEEARRQRDDNLRWNEVWGVFDVDDHPNLTRATALAADEGVEIAVSNPCFELWALLHFQDHYAHIERHKLRAALQRHMPGYDKTLDYGRMKDGYTAALRRAADLDREAARADAPGRNPTTGVPRLTESIRRPE